MFQSLVGFKINWNSRKSSCVASSGRFQSLVGFKINWNSRGGICPARGQGSPKFQSLVGFKINWNYSEYSHRIAIRSVSIPSRV